MREPSDRAVAGRRGEHATGDVAHDEGGAAAEAAAHDSTAGGRRARNETAIGERSISVSSIAAQQARDLFPDGVDESRPSYWACLRPMTPDGPPIMGTAKHRNLYFNTGHGHVGWTLACGAGRATAEMVFGRDPGIDMEGLRLEGREL